MIFPITGLVRLLCFFSHGETADPLNKGCHIRQATLLFKQHQITYPVSKLATVGGVIWSEHDTDITVERGLISFASTTWCAAIPKYRTYFGGGSISGPKIAFDLSEDRRLVTL
jgi:hypothetical protein